MYVYILAINRERMCQCEVLSAGRQVLLDYLIVSRSSDRDNKMHWVSLFSENMSSTGTADTCDMLQICIKYVFQCNMHVIPIAP